MHHDIPESYSFVLDKVQENFLINRKLNDHFSSILEKFPSENLGYDIGSTIKLFGVETLNIGILKSFMPWRKGPFEIFNIFVDCEWKSFIKFDVIANFIDFKDKKVLDIGCGNGYYMWRTFERGALEVVGIEPSILFFYQFQIIKKYLYSFPVHFFLMKFEDFKISNHFDITFSMGILYHRLSPIDHLKDVYATLKKDGIFVLETLIVEGDEKTVLVPKGRYAKMPNVWFLPSIKSLTNWLLKVGFIDVICIDQRITTLEEQRKTNWIYGQSLNDFVDFEKNETIEGLPIPTRSVLIARK